MKDKRRLARLPQRQWAIDPTDPTSIYEFAESHTNDGSADAASRHREGVQAQIERTLLETRNVGEDYLTQDVQSAALQPLQDAAHDEDGHVLGDAEDGGPDEEEEEGGIERDLATQNIGDADVDGLDDGDVEDGDVEGDKRKQDESGFFDFPAFGSDPNIVYQTHFSRS